jgi:hypothetical protein
MTDRVLTTAFLTTLAIALPAFAQERFDSADAAAKALIDAAGTHDSARLAAILGPQGSAILTSGNAAQDKSEQSEFSQLGKAMYQVEPDQRDPNRAILSIGKEDWPFPVPLTRSSGKWSFDPSQARVEMEARRIGIHELDAIEICAGYVEAQRKYASEDRAKDGMMAYAARVMSTSGRQNGLYGETPEGQFVPREFAEAVWDGQNKGTKPYHGYFFRMLDGQGQHAPGGEHTYLAGKKLIGGFALVAWPAQYGVTGIHTFIVNQLGIVYDKDLGPQTESAQLLVKRFDPDPSWTAVQ